MSSISLARIILFPCLFAGFLVVGTHTCAIAADNQHDPQMRTILPVTICTPDTGYRGIWYMNQPLKEGPYRYKYSGGLGTYCDYHQPMAVYSPAANKTFFTYGGAAPDNDRRLHHMVSYYDHSTGTVPRPVYLLDKQTSDAHDNPVISIDGEGHIWIFSSSHGLARPSYIHRSSKPYDISEFKQIDPTRLNEQKEVALDNYSYPQFWHDPAKGFVSFFTRYQYPAARTSCFMTSPDGVKWSEWQRLAAIGEGHYQTSAVSAKKIGTVMNYHPAGKGLNWRTNLYYLESADHGKTWQAADGTPLELPLTDVSNPALVHDYESKQKLVYLKDIALDSADRPVIVYGLSTHFASGPQDEPREIRITRWNGSQWDDHMVATIDHNYDSASLYLEEDGLWRIIGPTDPGPQAHCTGGEMVMWTSEDQGKTWNKTRTLTKNSPRNHSYARRPLNAHPDFYAIWADGDAQQPSESWLYFCNRAGDVFRLPRIMEGEFAKPEKISTGQTTASVPR